MNRKRSMDALNRPSLSENAQAEKHPVKVMLDDIRSLSNVGSIFRTCDSFHVEELLLCGITGTPPHRDIQRTALGATESVAWRHCDDALKEINTLISDGYLIIALEQCEHTIAPDELSIKPGDKVCLVVGNEVNGVNQQLIDASDLVVEIPQLGVKHSLNVTVATGIALWEIFKRQRTR